LTAAQTFDQEHSMSNRSALVDVTRKIHGWPNPRSTPPLDTGVISSADSR
jgi:hypothetical protein